MRSVHSDRDIVSTSHLSAALNDEGGYEYDGHDSEPEEESVELVGVAEWRFREVLLRYLHVGHREQRLRGGLFSFLACCFLQSTSADRY